MDDLLTNLMIYWSTGSITSSMRCVALFDSSPVKTCSIRNLLRLAHHRWALGLLNNTICMWRRSLHCLSPAGCQWCACQFLTNRCDLTWNQSLILSTLIAPTNVVACVHSVCVGCTVLWVGSWKHCPPFMR